MAAIRPKIKGAARNPVGIRVACGAASLVAHAKFASARQDCKKESRVCGSGLGKRNLNQCRRFFQTYPKIVRTVSAQFDNLLDSNTLKIPAAVSREFAGSVQRFLADEARRLDFGDSF